MRIINPNRRKPRVEFIPAIALILLVVFLAACGPSTPVARAPEPTDTAPPAQAPEPTDSCVSWREAEDYMGETTCVYGVVANTHDSGNAFFINFSTSDYSAFYGVSFDYGEAEWGDLTGQCVILYGTIEEYEGRAQIILDEWGWETSDSCDGRSLQPPDPPAPEPDPTTSCISWRDAEEYIGEWVCVYGVVTSTHDSGDVFFINFSETDYSAFYAVSFDYGEDYWGDLTGQCMILYGTIEEYEGRAEIILDEGEWEWLDLCAANEFGSNNDQSEATISDDFTIPWAFVISEGLNIRAGPGVEYDSLEVADRDEKFAVVGFASYEAWVAVIAGGMENPYIGYVSADHVVIEDHKVKPENYRRWEEWVQDFVNSAP